MRLTWMWRNTHVCTWVIVDLTHVEADAIDVNWRYVPHQAVNIDGSDVKYWVRRETVVDHVYSQCIL